jgi:trehalose utilization protein
MRTLVITSAMLLCLAPTSLLAQPSPPPDPNKLQVLIITGQHVLYANLRWQPDGSYHVLATAYDDHALYQGKARQPIPGAGIHQPMLWTTQYGMGRVFVTTLGHGPTEVAQLGFATTFARGAEWAATGKVTLPIPPELAIRTTVKGSDPFTLFHMTKA